MPPKKQQQQTNSQPYKPCFVLPLLLGDQQQILKTLKKPVNIKKDIDSSKIIQILKDKGLGPFIEQQNQNITKQGRKFVCENYNTVYQEVIQAISKPPDTKKDAKKDAKKQSKKQEPVAQVIPPLEFNYQKKCNDFFLLLDFPKNQSELRQIIKKGTKIDIVIVIKPKIKPGSRKPDYSLLKNERSAVDLEDTLNKTQIQANKQDSNTNSNDKQILKAFEKFKFECQSKQNSQELQSIKQSIIVNINWVKDLSHPEKDSDNFIQKFYQKLCKVTVDQEEFNAWKKQQKVVPMIQPIKETITKQVQVQSADKGKKGGKAEPTIQTVQQIVQTRYQSLPQNIKDNLHNYHKIKKLLSISQQPQNQYQTIIQSCIQSSSLQNQHQKQTIQSLTKTLSTIIKNKHEIKPYNKMTPQICSQYTRKISYPKQLIMQNQLKFDFPVEEVPASYMQLAHKQRNNLEALKIQYLVKKMQDLMKKKCPKIKWDFSDRKFMEKFNHKTISSIINQQLLKDPEIFAGKLQAQGIKLMILTCINPPGRVLYHNNIFPWKVLPDFQNWLENIDNFIATQSQFYDYSCSKAGNLSICSKNMMPCDNSIIRDTILTIGNSREKLIEITKNNSRFGIITDRNNRINYMHQLSQQYLVRANTVTRRLQTTNKQQQQQKQQQKQQQNHQQQQKSKQFSSMDITIQHKNNYIIHNNPYPTIHRLQKKSQETKRSYGSLGQITSYHRDGSIHIYYPNGNTSTYKNGQWTRIINNQLITSSSSKHRLKQTKIIQGETVIIIREDQTIFIMEANQNKRIIFVDMTEVYENVKARCREIKDPYGLVIRIYLPYLQYNQNIIGYGSAFAYLGFKNIRERSCDGYLFEVFDRDVSSHYYIEKYEREGKVESEEMRIIAYKDSSMLKVCASTASITYLSPNKNNILTQQYLHERWLQLFTTISNHGQGVFDIDLQKGIITNKDSQTNHFIAKIHEQSQAKIAVSFVKEDEEEDQGKTFGNGFHVKNQNYFLPPPLNRIPPRLFSIHADGSGVEYLNENQIGEMDSYTVSQQVRKGKLIRQYSLEVKPNSVSFMDLSFTEPIKLDKFSLPQILKASETRKHLIGSKFPQIKHRVIQSVHWNSDYSRVLDLQNQVLHQTTCKAAKMATIKTIKA